MLVLFSCSKDDVPDKTLAITNNLEQDPSTEIRDLNNKLQSREGEPDPDPPAEYGCLCGYAISDMTFVNNTSSPDIHACLKGSEGSIDNCPSCPGYFFGEFLPFSACGATPTSCIDAWPSLTPPLIYEFNCNQARNSEFTVTFLAGALNSGCMIDYLDLASVTFQIFCGNLGEDFSCANGAGEGYISDPITISFENGVFGQQTWETEEIELVGECGCEPRVKL